MTEKKRNWVQKLANSRGLPRVEKINEKMSKRWGTGTVIIPAPIEVDEMMREVQTGKLVTINEIRVAVSRKYNATIGCPMITGIFAWIVADAAEEERQLGEKDITPYWRTLKTGGVINPKYPGGIEGQKRLLEEEGHKVVQKGRKYVVANYEESLTKL